MPTVMNGVSLNALTTVDTWSALSLFANGEQGTWYDPSDMSTMFQNSAGTIPVTAVEQPVGLILDKSKNLAFGPELVGATWTCSDATWSQTGSTLTAVNGTGFSCYQAILTLGRWYKITFEIFDYSSGSIGVRLGNQGEPSGFSASANGTYSAIGLCAGDTAFYWMGGGTFNGKIRNISVKEIPGNHASQATDASRPVLSARVNLLTYSEQFSYPPAWQPGRIVSTGMANVTATTDPLGGNTADKLQEDTQNGEHYVVQGPITLTAAQYTFSVYLKAAERTWATIYLSAGGITETWFNLASDGTGVPGTVASGFTAASTYVGNGWYRCSITGTINSGTWYAVVNPSIGNGISAIYQGTLNSGIYVWGADLRVTNVGVGLPAYQRVATATDYDTSGFPLYLKFDGVDDSLATSSIDFTATDKMSMFVGHRIVSGTGSQLIFELGTNSYASSGFSFAQGPTIATPGLGFLMNAGSGIGAQTADKSVPYTSVSSLLLNSAQSGVSNEGILRSNTTLQTYTSTAGTDSGTANFPNKILYIGNRSGAAVWFNGHLYSLIVRGALSNSTQIENAENYINSKTKAY